MAGKVLNINVCSPLKLCSGLTGKYHAGTVPKSMIYNLFKKNKLV